MISHLWEEWLMFLYLILFLILAIWNLLSASVGFLFDKVLEAVLVGNIWLLVSFVLGVLVGTAIKRIDEGEVYLSKNWRYTSYA